MSMTEIKKVSFEEGKKLVQDYEYALVYYFSDKYFGEVSALAEIDWDECIEAYFFNKTGQLYMYEYESSEMDATVFEEKQDVKYNYIDRNYEIASAFKADAGKKITVREYLDSDEDGQTFVKYTRLLEIE